MKGEVHERRTVSILVPAYDQPQLLLRALKAIVRQDYRPIQVVVSFDKADADMSEVFHWINSVIDRDLEIETVQHNNSLGAYGNMRFLWFKAKGHYLMFHPHDDVLLHHEFLREAVGIMLSSDYVRVAIANSVNEAESGFGTLMMNVFCPEPEWLTCDGTEFVVNRLFNDLHPAYSAVLIDVAELVCRGYSQTWLSPSAYEPIKREPDEGFVAVMLAAIGNKVAINCQVVSLRGNPPSSWSKTDFWHNFGLEGLALQYANLQRVALERKDEITSKLAAKMWPSLLIRSQARCATFREIHRLGAPLRTVIRVWGFAIAFRLESSLLSLAKRFR